MPTLEGLKKATDLMQSTGKMISDPVNDVANTLNSQQAASQIKNGDMQGAYATLMRNPATAAQQAGNLGQMGFAGKVAEDQSAGKIAGELPTENDPNSLEQIRGQYSVDAAQARAHAMQNLRNMGTVHIPNPKTGYTEIYDKNMKTHIGTIDDSGNVIPPADSTDSTAPSGNFGGLGPKQATQLKPFITDFKKSADKMDETIDGSEMFQSLINGNLPGSKLPAVMKFLTSQEGVKRFNSDEFKQIGTPGNIADQVKQNLEQKAEGQPWTPQQQQYMKQIAQTMEVSTTNAYLDKIQSSATGAAASLGTKADAVEPIIAANAHPIVKQHYDTMMNIVNKDKDPVTSRQAIDWARHNATDPRAAAILKHYGF